MTVKANTGTTELPADKGSCSAQFYADLGSSEIYLLHSN